MSRAAPWLLLLVLACGSVWFYRNRQVQANPPQNAAAIVRSAWTEGREVALRGRQMIRMPGEAGKPVEVEADVLADGEGHLRIEYRTEPLKGVTVWENGDRTYRYNPKAKRLTVAKRQSPEDNRQAVDALLRNYKALHVGSREVAGRDAHVVELHPRSDGERHKRIWVDSRTSVILASEDISEKDGLLRSTRFVEIHYLDPDEKPSPNAFRPAEELIRRYATARPGDTSSRFEPQQLSDLIGFRIREPKWMPVGYRLLGAYQTPCACGVRHQAARLEYSDGLNTITVFQCGHPECRSAGNCFAAGDGAPQAVRLERDGVSYLAIGDAPRAELERMLRSAAE